MAEAGPPIRFHNLSEEEIKMVAQMTAFVDVGRMIEGRESDYGRLIANLPVDSRFIKFIYYGFKLGLLDECLTIASCMVTTTSPLSWPRCNHDKVNKYEAQLKLDDDDFSDHLLYLKIFKVLDNFNAELHDGLSEGEWIRKHGVNSDVFSYARIKKNLILRFLQRDNLMDGYRPLASTINEHDKNLLIKCCIVGGFLPLAYISTRGIGNTQPSLFKWTNESNSEFATKYFYDLNRTLTYKRVPFAVSNEEIIRHQVQRYFEERDEVICSVDTVVHESKLNVVFSNYNTKYHNVVMPLYRYHKYQQLKMGDIALTQPILGSLSYTTFGHAVGPHNTLELKFKNMVLRPPTEKIRVDGNSVCSIVFDSNFHQDQALDNSKPYMLIATNLKLQRVDAPTPHNVTLAKMNTLIHEGDGTVEVMLMLFGPGLVLHTDREVTFVEMTRDFGISHTIPGLPTVKVLRQFRHQSVGLKYFSIGSLGEFPIKYKCQFELSFEDVCKIYKAREALHIYSLKSSTLSAFSLQKLIIELLHRPRDRIPLPRPN